MSSCTSNTGVLPPGRCLDDFENYTDDEGTRIFDIWLDGWEDAANGSVVGNSEAPFAEQGIVHSGQQSMNLQYDNTEAAASEATRVFDSSQNWAADYMQDIYAHMDEISPADLSPELTKHFRGLRLWLPLKLFGLAPFRAALSEKIQLARYFYERIQHIDGFEVGPYPDLSVVTYRYLPQRGNADDFNQRLTQAIHADGRVFISSTRIDDKLVLRLAVSCFRTHLDDIEAPLEILDHKAKQLAADL